MELCWTQNTEGDFKEYRIYRDISADVSRKEDHLVATITDQSTITFTDATLDMSDEYSYRVYVVDTLGIYSVGSNIVTAHTLIPPINNYDFFDDMESGGDKWFEDLPWAISDDDAHSGSFSWSCSPNSAYASNSNRSLFLDINLGIATMPVLSFWHRYNFEKNKDFGYMEVSIDEGENWTRIYAVTGVGGVNWFHEKIDLTPWLGEELRIRFRVRSNESVNYDGWHVDDVRIGETETPLIAFPFYDGMNDASSEDTWHPSCWNIVSPSFDGTGYWNSSPEGKLSYDYDATKLYASLTLANNIDLSGSQHPQLVFWHKNDDSWGAFRVQISTNNGVDWETIASYNNVGVWTRVQLDLTNYFGLPVRLRFYLDGNNYYSWNTPYFWHIEDIFIQENPLQTPMVDYCELDSPDSVTTTVGVAAEDIYGLVYEQGVTEGSGMGDGITVSLGYGPEGSTPSFFGWTWMGAGYCADVDTMDRYRAVLTVNNEGTYDYAYRYQLEGSSVWLYGDLDGNDLGSGGTNGYSPSQAGKLIVNPGAAGILGDVNNSNSVTITDALIVATYDLDNTITIPNDGDIQLGDVNRNGTINITDALMIATYDIEPNNPNLPPGIGEPVSLVKAIALSLEYNNRRFEEAGMVKLDFSDTELRADQTITLALNIDATGIESRLGAYSAALSWDPKILNYTGYTGGNTTGFENPKVIREAGKLRFNQFHVPGASGKINVFNVSFQINGEVTEQAFKVNFSALTAAHNFQDLLPCLEMPGQKSLLSLFQALPEEFALSQNYPNPFNPKTIISYDLPQLCKVNISIFNIYGQKVKTLLDEDIQAGRHTVEWDGKNEKGENVASGLYLYRLVSDEFVRMRKMLFVR